MKKVISILLSLIFVLTALVLVSCGDNNGGGGGIDGDEFENVAVSSDGILTWTKLNRAKKYEILKGKMGTGADKETVTECSFDLKNFNLKTGEYDITLLGIEDNNELGETVEMEFAIYEMVIEVVNGEYSMRSLNYSDEYISLKGWEDADGTVTNYIKPQFYSDLAGATYTSLGKDITINGDNVWSLCSNSDYSGEVAIQTITGLKKGHNYYYIKLNDKNGTFIKGYKIDFYILERTDVKLYSATGEEIYSTYVWERESIDVATLYEKVDANEYIAYGSDILERDSAPVKAEKGKSFRAVSADEYNVLKHFDFSNGVLTKKKNHDCSGVDTLTIPAKILGQDVVKIGDGTTPICNIKTLTLSEGIKEIADYAFANTSLVTINIPDSVTMIGSKAFNGTSNLQTEKYGQFEYVGNWLVKSNNGEGELKPTTVGIACKITNSNIKLPDSLRYFDDEVFASVSLGNSTYVENVGRLKYIGNWLVGTSGKYNDSFTDVLLDTTVGILKQGIYYIKTDSLTIPASVRYIDKDAFAGCSIGSITGTDLIVNDGGMFLSKDKTTLYLVSANATQITIPDTVTYVASGAFSGAMSLQKLHIGANVGEISGLDSINLAEITVSPLNKTYFEKSGIIYCRTSNGSNGLKIFYVSKNISGNITLEEGIRDIPSNAFENCTGITGVIFPVGLEKIGYRAFRNCTSLTSIMLPEGLEKIEMLTFEGCTSLTSATIPESVTDIGSEAFGENVSVTFKATDNWYYVPAGGAVPVDVTDEAQLKKALKSSMYRKTN